MFLDIDLGEGHTWLLTSPSPPPWRCETWCVNRPNKEEREKTLFVRLPATGEKKKSKRNLWRAWGGGHGLYLLAVNTTNLLYPQLFS